jgi:hypothetical protein
MSTAVARGASAEDAAAPPSIAELARMREWPARDAEAHAASLIERIQRELEHI